MLTSLWTAIDQQWLYWVFVEALVIETCSDQALPADMGWLSVDSFTAEVCGAHQTCTDDANQ